jgi:hypothetical protein
MSVHLHLGHNNDPSNSSRSRCARRPTGAQQGRPSWGGTSWGDRHSVFWRDKKLLTRHPSWGEDKTCPSKACPCTAGKDRMRRKRWQKKEGHGTHATMSGRRKPLMYLHKATRQLLLSWKVLVADAARHAGTSTTPQPLPWTDAFLRRGLRPSLV